MPRLIDAAALERIVEEKFHEHYGNAVYQFIHDFFRFVIRQIRKAPTIDPESLIPHGRWVQCFEQDGEMCGYCSECNAIRFTDPYCPNCGAKMDLEEDK